MNRTFFCKSLLGLAAVLAVLVLCPPKTHGQDLGATERVFLKSEVLGEDRIALVRTPPGYERGGRYPVLYMTDGEAQFGHTVSTVSFLARNGRMPELIVVAIQNTDRTRDLTPTNSSLPLPGGRTQPFPTSGGADKFLKFIETELIPNIESKYRVHPYRIFAGHSFGGLFAIHAMLSRPELFNAYIAVSPSLFWDNDFELKRAEEFFKARKEWKKTLYLSLGNEPGDITTGFNRFTEILKQYQPKGFDYLAQQMPEEDHGSVVLRSHYAGLRKIFEDWQLPTNAETGAIVGDWAGVEEHYKRLSQEFGYTIEPSEGQVNQLGYQLLGQGKLDEAILVFKNNVARHSQSPNVYDSLGEAYENNGQLEQARASYEKAYKLGQERNDPNTQVFKANLDRLTAKGKEETGTKK